ncbi:MAG: hypothetical protein ACI4XJ_10820 [Eubacteriales bacterium]
MKHIRLIVILSIPVLVFSSCGDTADMTDTAETEAETEKNTVYTDYYTSAAPVITEFPIWDGKLDDNGLPRIYAPDRYCFIENGLYYCDITENPDPDVPVANIENGIFFESIDGERTRICPEPSCGADSICRHITMKNISLCAYGDKLYICGIPALDGGFYENTCIMELDPVTGAYVKIAEIPLSEGEFWQESHYLFLTAQTGEKNAVLYGVDLITMEGFRTCISSEANGPVYRGICNGGFLISDQYNLYLSYAHDQRQKIYASEYRLYGERLYGEQVYFLENHNLYRMEANDKQPEPVLENVCFFSIQNDVIYFTALENTSGLTYLSPFENEEGYIEYRAEDYPLQSGGTIYKCGIDGENTAPVLTKEYPDFLEGDVYVYGEYVYYTVLHGGEKPEKYIHIPRTLYRFNRESGEETVVDYSKDASWGFEC